MEIFIRGEQVTGTTGRLASATPAPHTGDVAASRKRHGYGTSAGLVALAPHFHHRHPSEQ